MVYFNMIMKFMKWLLFMLLPVVKCVITLGEKRLSLPVFFFKKQRDERGNPM